MGKLRHAECAAAVCPMEAALDRIDGKWKGVILFRLLETTQRFSDLRRLLPKVTARTLTLQLRELEADGLISRTVFPVTPPKVEYALTELGRSLEPVLMSLKTWGETYGRATPKGAAA